MHLFLTFLLLFHTVVLNASNYDDDILEIFSKIAPRLILMSSQKEKIQDDIQICILYEDDDKNIALDLIDKINHNYPNGIKNHKLLLLHNNYTQLNSCQNTQLAYLFDTDSYTINKSINFLNQYEILSISYNPQLLQNGVHASLFLGRKVMPYLNIKSIKENGIKLDNILLRVSKIYTKREE